MGTEIHNVLRFKFAKLTFKLVDPDGPGAQMTESQMGSSNFLTNKSRLARSNRKSNCTLSKTQAFRIAS
jgi:hypothetical protein